MTKRIPPSDINELDEIASGPLSDLEKKQLRRIIREYQTAQTIRRRVVWWLMFGLGIPAALVACNTFFRDVWGMFSH